MDGQQELQSRETKRTFDLRGGKSLTLEHPEQPVDVFIARQRLQIRKSPPGWEAPFILVDPNTYQKTKSIGWCENLYPGKKLVLGRNHPSHFQDNPEASPSHLSIEIQKGNKVVVSDLGSVNGSHVEIPPFQELPLSKRPTLKLSRTTQVPATVGLRPQFQPQPTTEKYWKAPSKPIIAPQPQSDRFKRPAYESFKKPSPVAVVEKKSTPLQEASRNIFEKAGKRSAMEAQTLISHVGQILINETQLGQNKLGRTIQETAKGPNGREYFVDGKISYLPPKGNAIIIGDTHGDSKSTEAIVRQTKFIESMERGKRDQVLVFLGDYADRGRNDVRNLEMILALKERYPQNVILMQGNHEDRSIPFDPYELPQSLQQHFGANTGHVLHGFYTDLFKQLPNMVVTANGLVATHGGVPIRETGNLQQLRNNETAFFQMRWNDPDENISESQHSERSLAHPIYKFGYAPFARFMQAIGGRVMVRGHEYPAQGYKFFFNNRLATIFSNGGQSLESRYGNHAEPKSRVQPKFATVSLSSPTAELKIQDISYR